MPMCYKVKVLEALKERGYSTYKLKNEKILHEMTLQAFRDGKMVSWSVLERICELLDCQPGDLIEYVKPEGQVTPDGE